MRCSFYVEILLPQLHLIIRQQHIENIMLRRVQNILINEQVCGISNLFLLKIPLKYKIPQILLIGIRIIDMINVFEMSFLLQLNVTTHRLFYVLMMDTPCMISCNFQQKFYPIFLQWTPYNYYTQVKQNTLCLQNIHFAY